MKLIVFPFDHRNSLKKITNKNLSEVKETIFEGFLDVYKNYKHKKYLAILIDEKYGKKVIEKAKKEKVKICLSLEKSGKNELELEYKNLRDVNKIRPDFLKILVRYNKSKKQLNTIKKVSDFCKKNNYKFILELLGPEDEVIPYIKKINAIAKIDIWKLEGQKKEQWQEITKIAKNIIILGRGEDKRRVKQWLKTAKPFKQVIGFAIGRTIFTKPIKKSKEKAIKEISKNFKEFLDYWNKL